MGATAAKNKINYNHVSKYEDSLFYQLNSNVRYFNVLFEQFFKELDIGLNAVEHLALSIILETKDCCQRDLARLLVKDRSNTGKIANNLEQRGFVKIQLKEKNNRPVKILTLTKKGKDICQKVYDIILPTVEKIYEEVDREAIEQAKNILQDFRKAVEKVVKVNI